MRIFYFTIILFFSSSSILAQKWTIEYDSLLSEGKAAISDNAYNDAVPFFNKAYELAKKNLDETRIADAGLSLGYSQILNGAVRAGAGILITIDSLYFDSFPIERKAFFKGRVAMGYSYLGEPEKAIHQYKEALAIASARNDTANIIQMANNLASRVVTVGDYDGAIAYANLVIKYTPKNDLYRLARINLSLYVAYLYKGMFDVATPHLFKSCELGTAIDSNSIMSLCYYYLSYHYQKENEYNKAITSSEQGLELAIKINDKEDVARYYYLLGELYLAIEETERALSYFNRVLDYYEQGGNKLLQGETLVRIALCFRLKKNFKEAEKLLLQALKYYETLENHYQKGQALLGLVDIKIAQEKDIEALEYLKKISLLGEEEDIFWLRQNSQSRLLKLNDSILPPTEKLSLSKEMFKATQRLSPNSKLLAEINLAKSFNTINSDSAFYWAESSFESIEKSRLSFKAGALKAGLFAEFATYYNEVGSWYANEKKDLSKAFELVEASKARALLDELAVANQDDELRLDETTQMRLLELQKTTDQLYRKREATSDDIEFQVLTNEIIDAELKYESTLERVASNNEAWNSFLYPTTLSLKEVQRLCEKGTAIIEYAFTEDKLLIFLISKNDAFYYESEPIPYISDSLAASINDFRDAIIAQADKPTLARKSSFLFSILIEPIAEKLSGFSNLVIVPDGPIAFLPFDVLQNDGRYLIKDHAIKYLPSVSVFNYIQPQNRKTQHAFLAIASSGFTSDNNNTSSIQKGFEALPFTLIEVDSIGNNFDDESKTILKNDAVTEATLKNISLDQYRYIHFATHGSINEIVPSQSGLILSKKQEMEVLFGEDGLLNAKEIASLNLNADLVVLSACDTGMGRVLTGEGLLGLQRSFIAAGASSVVSSLWSIYDRSTPIFMQSFYSKLLEYEDKENSFIKKLLRWSNLSKPKLVNYNTLALRDAKLDMIDHPYYNHPVHWASFVITGR